MAANDKGSLKEASKLPTRKPRPSTSSETQARTPKNADNKFDYPATASVNENLPLIERGTSSVTKGASGGPSAEIRAKEDKSKYDSSKCKCCEKALYSSANCMPKLPMVLSVLPQIVSGIEIRKLGKPSQVNQSIGSLSRLGSLGQVKFNRCSSCNGYVCRHCKGECHECIVRKQVVLEPEDMLQIDRNKLIGLLLILHYPKHHFDEWEKPFLVKQIFARFNVHHDWNPRPSSVISRDTIKSSPQSPHHPSPISHHSNSHSFRIRAIPLLSRKDAETPNTKPSKETKEDKPKSPIKKVSSEAQASTSSQVPNNSPTNPEASKVKRPNGNHENIKISKSNQDGTYVDLKLVVDDLPEVLPPLSRPEPKKENKDDKKSRKGSNISSTSTLPLKTALDSSPHQKEPADKDKTSDQQKPAGKSHIPKFDSVKQFKKSEITKSKESVSNASTPSSIRKVDQLKIIDRLDYSLKDISSLKDIDELPLKQIKSILTKHSFDVKTFTTEADMRYTVRRIWFFRKEKENEAKISGSLEDVRQKGKHQKQNAAMDKPRSTSESQLHQDQTKKVQEASRERTRPDALRLEKLSSFKSIERMDVSHLSSTLRNHNISPGKYKTRQELVYAVQCLWHAIHAADNIGGTDVSSKRGHHQKSEKKLAAIPVTEEAKSNSITKLDKCPSISNVSSVMELEKLTEEELRQILEKNSIKPGQYNEKHELYYAVLLLWNSKKIAAKEATSHSKPVTKEHQKAEYVTSWLLKQDDIVIPKPAKEVRNSEKKRQPLQQSSSSSEQVQKLADNSAAIRQLNDQKSEAIRQVIGSTPVMGTQLDVKRKQHNHGNTMETEQRTPKKHEFVMEKLKTEEKDKKGANTKERHYANVDVPKQVAKIEGLQETNHSSPGVIYSEIFIGSQNQNVQVTKKVIAKLERQAEVTYAELVQSPQPTPTGDSCSSIISFGERIAPASTELEFAFIDDTLSEMSVNQGTRNERNTSTSSSYYNKLLDVRYNK